MLTSTEPKKKRGPAPKPFKEKFVAVQARVKREHYSTVVKLINELIKPYR